VKKKWIVKLRRDVLNLEEWGISVLALPKRRVKFLLFYGDKPLRQGNTDGSGRKDFTAFTKEFDEEPVHEKLRIEEVKEEPKGEQFPAGTTAEEPKATPTQEPTPQPADQPEPKVQPRPVAKDDPSRKRKVLLPHPEHLRAMRRSARASKPNAEAQPIRATHLEILSPTPVGWEGTCVPIQVTGKRGRKHVPVMGAVVAVKDPGVAMKWLRTNEDGLCEYMAPTSYGRRTIHITLTGTVPVVETNAWVNPPQPPRR